jgi:hypothetical protein
MAEKSWEAMSVDEKLDWLRRQLVGLINFINDLALPHLQHQVAQIVTRITALENPPSDSEEVEPK